MDIERAKVMRPAAPPRVFEGAYTEDQHRRLLEVVRREGPCSDGGSPHIDGAEFRGLSHHNCPVWLANTLVKTGLFRAWQVKKAQVIAWYYQGSIGGGFTYWPDGPHEQPRQIHAPMWGRAVVVENEMMYHSAQSNGPEAMRKPADPLTDPAFIGLLTRVYDPGRPLYFPPEPEAAA